jgi:hypothetical protein
MEKASEYVLIAEGDYETVDEAKRALAAPFLEEYIERTGRFRIDDYELIQVAGGISLADLEIAEIDSFLFEISLRSSPKMLKLHKAREIADVLRRQLVFDEIRIEPLE